MLKSYSRLYLEGPGRDEVRPAKRREEVIQRNLIRDVHHRESQAYLVVICSEQIVCPSAEVKQMPRHDARRIRIVVFSSVGGNPHTQCSAIARRAGADWVRQRRKCRAAEQSDLLLF